MSISNIKLASKPVQDYWNFLIITGLLMPNKKGSNFFFCVLMPKFLKELRIKENN
tara:strand:- start:984 stop:1148 length:165 start_codon:yes stop_codon:yes gene_type:complete